MEPRFLTGTEGFPGIDAQQFATAGPTPNAPAQGGILSSLTSPWVLGGLGLSGLDLFSKRKRQEEAEDIAGQIEGESEEEYRQRLLAHQQAGTELDEGTAAYLDQVGKAQEAAQWTESDRSNMMKAIMGIVSEQQQAETSRLASDLASAGRGGGTYQAGLEKIRRGGLETAARALAPTFGPANIPIPNIGAYLAKPSLTERTPTKRPTGVTTAALRSKDAFSSWLEDILGLAGTLGGQYLGAKTIAGLMKA
jgi:hypothetical protein